MPDKALIKEKSSLSLVTQNKLFETTSIYPLVLVNKSKYKLETFFWWAVVVGLSIFTFVNLYRLIIGFLSDATVTSVYVTRMPMKLNNLTVCVRAELPIFYCELYHPIDVQFMKDNQIHCKPWSLSNDINNFLTKANTSEKFLTESWPNFMLGLLHPYFRYMSGVEAKQMGIYEIQKGNMIYSRVINRLGNVNMPTENRIIFLDSLHQILNHTAQLGINSLQLFEKFGNEVAYFLMMNIYLEKVAQTGLLPGASLYPSYFTEDKELCYQTRYHATFGEHQVTLQIHNYNLNQELLTYNITRASLRKVTVPHMMNDVASTYYLSDEPTLSVYVDPLHFPHPAPEASAAVRMDEISAASLAVSATYKSVSRCSKDSSQDECIARCRIHEFIKHCNCSPVTYWKESMQSNLVYCNLFDRPLCISLIPGWNPEYENCTLKCKPSCQLTHYSMSQSRRSTTSPGVGEIVVKSLLTEYPVFVEAYEQTMAKFLGQLGGILDFYLGISVVAVLHVVVYLSKQVMYLFNKETKPGKQIRESVRKRKQTIEEEAEYNEA